MIRVTISKAQSGRCVSCRHWTRHAHNGAHSGKCQSSAFSYGAQTTAHDGLAYWDDEEYGASFSTGENFGCVHWDSMSAQGEG
jgi:hypothetical protein